MRSSESPARVAGSPTRSLHRPWGNVGAHPPHDLLERGSGREDRANPAFVQSFRILFRNDAAPEQDDVIASAVSERFEHRGEECVVCPRHDRKSDRIHVLLDCCNGDHFRCLVEPGVNHLEARISQGSSDYFGAAIVAVESRFGHQNADLRSRHRPRMQRE